MELKEGMYVRFKDKRGNHYIRKITEVCSDYPHKAWGGIFIDIEANYVKTVSLKNIITTSENIADVLVAGDIAIMLAYGLPIFKQISESDLLDIKLGNFQVIEVITKEQFKANSYEL